MLQRFHLPRHAAAAAALLAPLTLAPTAEAKGPRRPAASVPASKQASPGEDWIRLTQDSSGAPQAMQTAVVRYDGVYAPAGGPVSVDLIGAVHIGDAEYYEKLNQRFKDYDALLYELVAPEGTIVRPGAKADTRNPLGAMQSGTSSLLELDHQLEKIDYTPDNFVHADMSPEQFFQSMKDRNEGIVSMYMKMVGQGIAVQSSGAAGGTGGGEMELLFAFFAQDRARRLKIAMAKQFAESEALFSGFGGEEGSTLISERNKVALEVLKRELSLGKRRVGIFYGAGHLDDMDTRLRRDFGLKPTSETWVSAWDLTKK